MTTLATTIPLITEKIRVPAKSVYYADLVAAKNLIDPVLGPAVRITIGVVSGTLKYYEPGDPSNEKTITASLLGKMGGIFEHQVNSLSAGQAHTEVLVEWA